MSYNKISFLLVFLLYYIIIVKKNILCENKNLEIIWEYNLDVLKKKIKMNNSVLYVSLVAASKYIGAGMAVSGVIGAGAGIGIIFAGYMIAVARNPYLQNVLLRYVFLGFALTEALGLLSIMMAFLILYV